MSDFDLRNNPFVNGYPIESQRLSLDIYQLTCIFASSKTLWKLQGGGDGGTVWGWNKESFELSEVSRLLISIAASCRNIMDSFGISKEVTGLDSVPCGILYPNLEQKKVKKDLLFREACNKIIHATGINFDLSKAHNIKTGYLNPFVYLYGELQGKKWKVKLDVYHFCENCHCIT